MNCPFCQQPFGSAWTARHACPSCGRPQPENAQENYFQILGVTEKFKQDLLQIQKNFYEVSRLLHPDRFSIADEDTKNLSLQRMSLLNQAYLTLTNPEKLRDYILELHAVSEKAAESSKAARGQVPVELAEGWFELQDSLAENPDQAEGKLKSFEIELRELRAQLENQIRMKEAEFDAIGAGSDARPSVLKKLAQDIQRLSYLKSMDRDVERIKTRLSR